MEVSKKRKWKIVALLLATLLLPAVAKAQQSGGLLGYGPQPDYGNRDGGLSGGVFNQGFGGTEGSLFNQGFGATQGGLDNQGFGGIESGITNQGFGETPVGSGLFVLLAAGAGYVAFKTKTKKTKKVKH